MGSTFTQRDFADLEGARAAKDRALNLIRAQGLASDAQIATFLAYYQPALKRCREVDNRDTLRRIMGGLHRDIEEVDRVREHLVLTGVHTQSPEHLATLQQLLAALELVLKKLRRLYSDLAQEQWTWWVLEGNPAMLSAHKKPQKGSKKDAPRELVEPSPAAKGASKKQP